jgi:hypothetical protein
MYRRLRRLFPIFIFMILVGIFDGFAQEIRWLSVNPLQSPFSEFGMEYENEFNTANSNFFSWPSQYGSDQNVMRMRALWIGCTNFEDPVEKTVKVYKVIGIGPRDGITSPPHIFPQEIKLLGRFNHPQVIVDEEPASFLSTYDVLDQIIPFIQADRVLYIRFNTSMGISVTKKVFAFSQPNHDNYFIHDYVFKNTGIYDSAGSVRYQTLTGLWFYFLYRHSFAGISNWGYNTGWGAFSSTWGNSQVYHSFGEDPGSPDFLMRGFYSWYGPSKERYAVTYDEDWGCPEQDADGMMASAKYAGCVTLHADKSGFDHTDDLNQPITTWFICPDISIMHQNASQYDDVFMADRYSAMSEGHPTVHHDVLVDDGYPVDYTDARRQTGGGTSQGQGFGPYSLAPGDSIHIVFAEGVAGLSWDKNLEVGHNWHQWRQSLGTPNLVLPNGSTTTDHNLYKRRWVETGRDSILSTFVNARNNYQSGYQIPSAPPPPEQFFVTSKSGRIKLDWSDNAETWPGFNGYVIYRSVNDVLSRNTLYQKIFECGKNSVINSFEDLTCVGPNEYYYYIQTKDDGSTNDRFPGIPLTSSMFWTLTNIPASPTPLGGITSSPVIKTYALGQNYPNPFNPVTTIEYQLPQTSYVIIKVYDILGRKIATLVDQYKKAGKYSYTFDASLLPSGTYFYRMSAVSSDHPGNNPGNYCETKKFVVLK